MASVIIGDYKYTSYSNYATVRVVDKSKSSYGEILDSVEIENETYVITTLTYCFRDCVNLISAPEIPSSITGMSGCFYNCTSLTQAPKIPNGVTDINRCFYNCYKLTDAPKIPSSVMNMHSCFDGCRSLTQAPEIPNSVTDVSRCFYDCINLIDSIIIHSKPTNYSSIFRNLSNPIEIYTIDENEVGVYNFWKNQAGLPSNVTVAEDIPNNTEFTVGDYKYKKYGNLKLEVKAIDKTKTEYGPIKESIVIGNGNEYKIRSMEDCFRDCQFLIKAPDIPQFVNDLRYCFRNCRSLEIPPEISSTQIYDIKGCFMDCAKLSNPPNVFNVPNLIDMTSCFAGCHSLTQAPEIPEAVEEMKQCFYFCRSLKGNIYVNNSIINDYRYIFADINNTNDIYIINNTSPKDESVSTKWREIVAYTNNPKIHFEADDHTPPMATLKLTRTDSNGEPFQGGTWVHIIVNYEIFQDNIPIGWTASTLVSERLAHDSDEEFVPVREGRDRGIYDLEDEEQHIIIYTINDGYKTTTITATLSRVMALLDFFGNPTNKKYTDDKPGMGMAIGKMADRNGLDIQFPTTIGEGLLPSIIRRYDLVENPDAGANPSEEGWYERSGAAEPYTYTLTQDTKIVSGKDYYKKVEYVDLNNYQLIIGKYNKQNDESVFIIGNGSDDNNRKNLMEVGTDLIKIGEQNGIKIDENTFRMFNIEEEGINKIEKNSLLINNNGNSIVNKHQEIYLSKVPINSENIEFTIESEEVYGTEDPIYGDLFLTSTITKDTLAQLFDEYHLRPTDARIYIEVIRKGPNKTETRFIRFSYSDGQEKKIGEWPSWLPIDISFVPTGTWKENTELTAGDGLSYSLKINGTLSIERTISSIWLSSQTPLKIIKHLGNDVKEGYPIIKTFTTLPKTEELDSSTSVSVSRIEGSKNAKIIINQTGQLSFRDGEPWFEIEYVSNENFITMELGYQGSRMLLSLPDSPAEDTSDYKIYKSIEKLEWEEAIIDKEEQSFLSIKETLGQILETGSFLKNNRLYVNYLDDNVARMVLGLGIEDDAVSLGYGGYQAMIGETRVFGNYIKLQARQEIAINGDIKMNGFVNLGTSCYYKNDPIEYLTHSSISIKTQEFNVNINGGTSVDKTGETAIRLTEYSGYSPRCVVGWHAQGTNGSWIFASKLYVNQTDRLLICNFRNMGTNNFNGTIRVFVLYDKY